MEKPAGTARCHALVSGRVQGVFFRMFVLREAQRLGLTGVVRNLPDGRVETVAEGSRRKLEELVARLRVGPSAAAVRDVAVEWEPFEHEFDSFDIAYG